MIGCHSFHQPLSVTLHKRIKYAGPTPPHPTPGIYKIQKRTSLILASKERGLYEMMTLLLQEIANYIKA